MANKRHHYSVGQTVLCFEPDLNKEIILYVAKIIGLGGHRYEEGRCQPIYELHFKGWKDKWNREVSQEMLLENTPFNMTLKQKIDEVVLNVRNPMKRKERILSIIEHTVGSNHYGRNTSAGTGIGENFDWNTVPGVWLPEEAERKRKRKSHIDGSADSHESNNISAPPSPQSTTVQENDTEHVHDPKASENKPLFAILQPNIELPTSLHHIALLHLDLKTPRDVLSHCNISVVDMLQTYIDLFPQLDSSAILKDFIPLCGQEQADILISEANPHTLEYLFYDVNLFDTSHQLCLEVCSSLRLMFDVYARCILLSSTEKSQPHETWLLPISGSSKVATSSEAALSSGENEGDVTDEAATSHATTRSGRHFSSSTPNTPRSLKHKRSPSPTSHKTVTPKKRGSRTNDSQEVFELNANPPLSNNVCSLPQSILQDSHHSTIDVAQSTPITKYPLLPLSERERACRMKMPSLRFPAVFFLRLLIKLPQILPQMNLTLCRRVLVHRHVMQLIVFLEKNVYLLWK